MALIVCLSTTFVGKKSMEEILLQGMNNVPADGACGKGALALSVGCLYEYGALAPVSHHAVSAVMPEGCTLMCMHHTPFGTRYVFGDSDGLYWGCADEPGVTLSKDEAHRVSAQLCTNADVADGRLVYVDSEGMHMAVAVADGYRVMRSEAPRPVIEFALISAGHVAVGQAMQLPASMCGLSGTGVAGSGAWTVHAPSAVHTANHESAASKVHARLMQAIDCQASSRGMFHQPFMVRYAVRMTDGTYAAVSPPVAMLPSVVPPCFAVASSVSVDDDECIVTFSSMSAHYCKLRYRVVCGLDAGAATDVAAVDIFCSKQQLTYRTDVAGTDGVVGYKSMVADTNTVGRGDAASADGIFVGHWADFDDKSVDHTLEDMPWRDSKCWQLLPDPMWTTRLLADNEFYRVASVPLSMLEVDGQFHNVEIYDIGNEAIALSPRLEETPIVRASLLPEAMIIEGDEIVISGSACSPGYVWPLRAMTVCGSRDAESLCHIKVLARGQSGAYSVGLECTGTMSESRYLYTDIVGAYAIVVSGEDGDFMLPLSPHPTLAGAYWWGGVSKVPIAGNKIDASDLPPQLSSIECGACVEICSVHNPWHVTRRWRLPCCHVVAMARSLRAVSSGQFGQYVRYVFTDDALWILPNTGDEPVMISTDTCTSKFAVAEVEGSIVYASRRGLHQVTGSKSVTISGDLSGCCGMSVDDLPHIADVLQGYVPRSYESFRALLAHAHLIYDKYQGRLWLSGYSPVSYVYSMESGKWGMAWGALQAPLCFSRYATSYDGRIVDLENCADLPVRVALITRPIKYERGALSRISAGGRLSGVDSMICVYGSDDLAAWHSVASSPSASTDIVTGTQYQYYIVAFVATLPLPCHITHLCLESFS